MGELAMAECILRQAAEIDRLKKHNESLQAALETARERRNAAQNVCRKQRSEINRLRGLPQYRS